MRVTVGVPAYNHEAYIRQALQSIVDQEQIGFEMEVLIFDDASTDGTPRICREFEQKYPFVHYMPSASNLGIEGNGPRILRHCTGDFIAFCDGDDYWTDTRKLYKQLSVFAGDPGIAAVYHNVGLLTENGHGKLIYPEDHPQVLGFKDIMKGHFMKTSALVLRNHPGLFDPIINGDLPADDTSLCLLALEHGEKGYYLPEVMAVYRVHEKGVWSKIDQIRKLEWSEKSLFRYASYYRSRRDVSDLWKHLFSVRKDLFIQRLKRREIISAVKILIPMLRAKLSSKT